MTAYRDNAGVVIVCPVKTTADIGGFPVGQYLTDEFYVGRALGIGIDKTKVTTELSENGNGGSSSGGSSDNSQQGGQQTSGGSGNNSNTDPEG